jgi:hypothetical protein
MKNLKQRRTNAEEDYITTPISVLAYISHLERSNKNLFWAGLSMGATILAFVCILLIYVAL